MWRSTSPAVAGDGDRRNLARRRWSRRAATSCTSPVASASLVFEFADTGVGRLPPESLRKELGEHVVFLLGAGSMPHADERGHVAPFRRHRARGELLDEHA
jgi:hypothetical protein